MKKFAVSYISFFDNKMTIKIVEANDWKAALVQSEFMKDYDDLPEDFEEAKQAAFDCDSMFEVMEIPND